MVRLVSLAFMLVATPGGAIAQGVPVNDSGLTARDLVETADRDKDLALQREKLTVGECGGSARLARGSRICDCRSEAEGTDGPTPCDPHL